MPGRTIAKIPLPPIRDLSPRTDLLSWARFLPPFAALPSGFVIVLLSAFLDQVNPVYYRLFKGFTMPSTKRGPGAMPKDIPSKRGGRATTRRLSG